MKYSKFIKQIRAQKNLSQEAFAKLLGVSRAYLASIEIEQRGTKPSRDFLEALYRNGVSIDELFRKAEAAEYEQGSNDDASWRTGDDVLLNRNEFPTVWEDKR